MPPYVDATMSSSEEPNNDEEGGRGGEQEESELLAALSDPKARERDLLAIIAIKDKQIQQLEQKLEAQSVFIDAVLKLSDDYRGSSNKGNRRVSWFDQPQEESHLPRIDMITKLDVEDDLSVLSQEGEEQHAAEAPKPSASRGAVVYDDDDDDDDDEEEVDPDAIAAALVVQSKKTKTGEVDIDDMIEARTKHSETNTAAARTRQSDEFSEEESTSNLQPMKLKPSKAERRIIQHIIERLRNDDDSVSV